MKWLPLIVFFALLLPSGFSAGQVAPQGPGRISGTILNPDGQGLPAAAIAILSARDSSLITGALTAKDGKFMIDGLPLGGYTIRVSLIGYKPRRSEVVTLTREAVNYDFGSIKLDLSAIQLPGVEATGQRAPVVQEADRTTYNARTMPQSAGTAIDLLKAIPDLEVDINNNVKLRGNQTVAVQLNGRTFPLRGEQLANFLQQLPGNRVARVEVIHNPSAKNSPEEMGGILNIVLEDKIELGVSGSVNANTSTRNRQGFGGRLNFQRGKLTLFTGLAGNVYDDESASYDLRQNLITRPPTNIEQNGAYNYANYGAYGDVTAEFKLSPQAALSTTSYWSYSTNQSDGLLKYGILDQAMAARERYDRDSRNDGYYSNYDVGLNFRQIYVQQRHELSFSGRISNSASDSEDLLTKEFTMADGSPVVLPVEITRSDYDSGSGNLSIQVDYFRPVEKMRVDVGYRAWKRDQENDNLLRIFPDVAALTPRELTRSGFAYDEVFHSFYATASRPFGKFSVQAGLRAELTATHFDSHIVDLEFDRSYNTLYPSVNLAYTPKPGRTARFYFSRSIGRPSPGYLNPVVPSTDPLNRSIGNPDLQPSYTFNYRMNLTWSGKRGSLNAGPYYTHTLDMWERIRTVDTLGVATSRWENGNFVDRYGTSLGVSLPSSGNLNGNVSMTVYREERDGRNISQAYRAAAWMTSYSGYLGYKVRPATTATFNVHYTPMQSILQGRASGYMYMTLGMRQQLWGTKGSLNLNVQDPFALQKYNSNTRDATYIQTSRSTNRSRVATLGFNWNFGKPPQRLTRGMEGGGGDSGEVIRVR
ncbi:MAG: TonB-dependent receptor domain-containing protein [Longimicrobiales bacterium]